MSQTYWWSLYGDLAGKPTGIFFAGVLVLVGAMCFDLCGDLFVKQNSPSSELVSGSVHPDCWRAYGCFRLDAKPAFYTCLLLAGIGGGIATVLAGTDCPVQGMVPANGSSSDDNWVHSTAAYVGASGREYGWGDRVQARRHGHALCWDRSEVRDLICAGSVDHCKPCWPVLPAAGLSLLCLL